LCVFLYQPYIVYSIYCIRYFKVLVRDICNNGVYDILHRWVLSSEQKLANFVLSCTMTNKCTFKGQIITLLRVSTLLCHPQGARI